MYMHISTNSPVCQQRKKESAGWLICQRKMLETPRFCFPKKMSQNSKEIDNFSMLLQATLAEGIHLAKQ